MDAAIEVDADTDIDIDIGIGRYGRDGDSGADLR